MTVRDFYKQKITVARVYGIPVRIDYRWFVVFALSVWLIANNLHTVPLELPGMRLPPVNLLTAWTLGVIATAGLFLSVLGHELSHALMGRAEGIEIEEIVLHPFGGLARLKTQPENPQAEFRIAIAGPAASFVFAILAFVGATRCLRRLPNRRGRLLPDRRREPAAGDFQSVARLSARRRPRPACFALAAQRRHLPGHSAGWDLWRADRRHVDHLRHLHGRRPELSGVFYGAVVGARRPLPAGLGGECRAAKQQFENCDGLGRHVAAFRP